MDARVAGILALEANRLLQPLAWAAVEESEQGPAGQGPKKQWRPVWVLSGEGEGAGHAEAARAAGGGGGDRSLSAPRFASPQLPPGHHSRSRNRSESTARGASFSAAAAASLPLSGRLTCVRPSVTRVAPEPLWAAVSRSRWMPARARPCASSRITPPNFCRLGSTYAGPAATRALRMRLKVGCSTALKLMPHAKKNSPMALSACQMGGCWVEGGVV